MKATYTLSFCASEYVPAEGRAEWLDKFGPVPRETGGDWRGNPKESHKVTCSAPLTAWEGADCPIRTDGSLSSVNRVVECRLRAEVAALFVAGGPAAVPAELPEDAVLRALEAAREDILAAKVRHEAKEAQFAAERHEREVARVAAEAAEAAAKVALRELARAYEDLAPAEAAGYAVEAKAARRLVKTIALAGLATARARCERPSSAKDEVIVIQE